ncbi:hypothetical protein RFI_36584 [Reticulomyxa filosa]|uniref:Uncharacterized protein n=1 Tax=Reticulomyxa filosa TaxID=46433 RepID=X6LHL5_RETFI|nr:hypothetical protein RFI_36584 [Reticulomyxa filosa]|eukprot:ETO00856.1 hypothetical protein RFI_36584 [Reticulomyxa filosa]
MPVRTYPASKKKILLIFEFFANLSNKIKTLSESKFFSDKFYEFKYKNGYPFKQMLNDIRQEIRKSKNGEWYCVETQDTTSYDVVFIARKTS